MDVPEFVPFSVWEKILKQSAVSGKDILEFCSTCEQFYELVHSPVVWKSKVAQRWPSLKKQLEKCRVNDWAEIYRNRYVMGVETKKALDNMAARYIREDMLHLSDSAFEPIMELASRCEFGGLYLIDELRCILNESPENLRLTDKYYATSAIRYLMQEAMAPRWRQWIEGGQILEEGAWLFAQWFLPAAYLDESILEDNMDRMVQETKRKVVEVNKRHPLLRRGSIDHANLRETIWNVAKTREIVEALNFVFSSFNGFRGNASDYYNMKNSFLNEVLETKLGIPITLCVLYHAVARRLGVYCAPVNFPSHFLLKFLDHPELSSESQKYTYIDVFNSCRLMREDQVWATHAPPSMRPDRSFFQIPDSIAVLVRMVYNIAHIEQSYRPTDSIIKRSAWELGVILKPMDFDMRMALARKYFRLDINIEKIRQLMEEIPEPLDELQRAQKQHFIEMARTRMLAIAIYKEESSSAPKKRSAYPHVQYSVGSILRHKQYHYTCVVTGWDPVCAASDSWKMQMGVQNLPRKDRQPFYHVLVHDGTNRYAAEENMIFEPNPITITHPEVGKYFQEFCENHYKMNKERSHDYPEDEKTTVEYAEKAYSIFVDEQ